MEMEIGMETTSNRINAMEDKTFSTNNFDLAAQLFALDTKLKCFSMDKRGFVQFEFCGDCIEETLNKISQNVPIGCQDLVHALRYLRSIITGVRRNGGQNGKSAG
jgi:hypothetical protein